jgi:hypothetical protein
VLAGSPSSPAMRQRFLQHETRRSRKVLVRLGALSSHMKLAAVQSVTHQCCTFRRTGRHAGVPVLRRAAARHQVRLLDSAA